MKTHMSKFRAIVLGLALVASTVPMTAQAQSGCLSSYDSRIAISDGKAKALGWLMKRRGESNLVGNIIEASLCKTSGNRLYYQVKLLSGTGMVAKLRFYANDGSSF